MTNKKYSIIFFLCIMICMMSVNTYALVNLDYYKYKNNVVISVEELQDERVILVTAQYSELENKLIQVKITNIKEHDGSYESDIISLTKDVKYKFFILDYEKKMTPLCKALFITASTPDGSGEGVDGEYTKPY